MRRGSGIAGLLLALCLWFVGFSGGACAGTIFPFIPDSYTFSQQQVQAAVAQRFPYRRTVSSVLDIELSHPTVGFLPQANRVSVRLDASLTSPFLQDPVTGTVTFSSQLAYDAARRAVILKAPTADSVDMNTEAYAAPIRAVATFAAQSWLADYPIYVFQPEQLQFAGVHYEPGTISVTPNGIRVQILEKCCGESR